MFYAKRGGKNLFRPVIVSKKEIVKEEKIDKKIREPKPNKKGQKVVSINNIVETQIKNEGDKLEQD